MSHDPSPYEGSGAIAILVAALLAAFLIAVVMVGAALIQAHVEESAANSVRYANRV